MRILVTGGCGFIGSNFIHYFLSRYPEHQIVNLDKLTYAGNLYNLSEISGHPNYLFIQGDIADPVVLEKVFGEGIDGIVHFAAESHVDRSIEDAKVFVQTNVVGTYQLLDFARRYKVRRFLHISTDEVYGELGNRGVFTESSMIQPNSPYAASKASSDLLVKAFFRTYGLPVVITRCSNNYGPYQFPEKLIPLMIINAVRNLPLPVYGNGQNVRDWIYVTDHCEALERVFFEGKEGEVYNIGGDGERTNLQVVQAILDYMKKPRSLITFVKDRPGHDFRYAMDYTKLRRTLGWRPRVTFEEGIKKTVDWYMDHRPWWEAILSGTYRDRVYDRQKESRVDVKYSNQPRHNILVKG